MKRIAEIEAKNLKTDDEHLKFQRGLDIGRNDRVLNVQKLNERRIMFGERRFDSRERHHTLDREERK